ncbi:hypothetical protein BASA81_010788 [Batrachochytrium salamandrivorans]|nr:hypothetical protein BASA81_010788 [Batrachochytrium salamandrivorans]
MLRTRRRFCGQSLAHRPRPCAVRPPLPALLLLFPRTPKSSVLEFECLEDTDELWTKRVERAAKFTQDHCHEEVLSSLGPQHAPQTVVPVVFVFQIQGPVQPNSITMLSWSLNTAAKFNDKVVLLLFGTKHQNVTDQLQVQSNVEIVKVTAPTDPLMVAFQSFDRPLYKHNSTNRIAYELFCFQRWFAIQKLMELRRYEHVFAIDNDVLLLTNVTQQAELCFRGCETFGYLVFSKYFTAQALQTFTRNIVDFYTRPVQPELTPVVSDMTVHMFYHDRRQLHDNSSKLDYCTKGMSREQKPQLAFGLPFAGRLVQYFQDDLGLPHTLPAQDKYDKPNMLQNIHFSAYTKSVLVACPRIKI